MHQLCAILNIPRNRYEHWENRNIEPPIEKLIELAKIYGLTVDELIKNGAESKSDLSIENKLLAAPENIKKAVYALLEL